MVWQYDDYLQMNEATWPREESKVDPRYMRQMLVAKNQLTPPLKGAGSKGADGMMKRPSRVARMAQGHPREAVLVNRRLT
jgi:hypothetical protein